MATKPKRTAATQREAEPAPTEHEGSRAGGSPAAGGGTTPWPWLAPGSGGSSPWPWLASESAGAFDPAAMFGAFKEMMPMLSGFPGMPGAQAAGAPGGPAAAMMAGMQQWMSAMFPGGKPPMGDFTPRLPSLPSVPGIKLDPARLAALQTEYVARWQKLLSGSADGKAPSIKDKRFADSSWQNNGLYSWTAALYLLNSEFLQKMADAVEGDAKTRDRIRFATLQWIEAMSPANFFASNPEAQRMLIQTQGKSLMAGMENMISDMRRGKLSQNDDEAFEVGRNVATSAGAVVFENELVQLIQYEPSTPTVGARPILLVPPCINKFYIMDLQPDNSMVQFLVSQGMTVFMVSWRNVGAEQGHLTWDDYLARGVIETIHVVKELSGQDKINLLGFCVGGTIVTTALAALAAQGEHPVESLTLLTTLLDFSEPGVLGVFIDEQQVQMREQQLGKGGLLSGRDLATTFSFLRPSDLVWNYVVNNYLKGGRPPAFDLLYWNGDSTNLPGPMYCWYLRHMYLQNELREPDRLTCLGEPIDLKRVDVPAFVMAAREDHIVPWVAAYQTTQLLGGDVRFVLSASGHIAGTINPASKNKRNYWTGERQPADPEQWMATATEHPGSWWNAWIEWLKPKMGPMQPAPKQLGSDRYPPIERAPGRYVKQPA